MNDPYMLCIVAKGYKLHFGKYDLPRVHRRFRECESNIPNPLKERNQRDTSGFSRVLFEGIPGTQGMEGFVQ